MQLLLTSQQKLHNSETMINVSTTSASSCLFAASFLVTALADLWQSHLILMVCYVLRAFV